MKIAICWFRRDLRLTGNPAHRTGAHWFWDTLVDADLANNTMGWQWTAGWDADPAPYFRTFNPATHAEKFDPEGAYVKRWLPELQYLPPAQVHRPWESLPPGYPAPVLDLKPAGRMRSRRSRASDRRMVPDAFASGANSLKRALRRN